MTKEELRFIKEEHVNNNLKIYQENIELVKLYEEYISHVVELFDLIKKDESDYFYAIVCDILIDAGFFSAERRFSSKNDEFNELPIMRGVNIINGEGICRNIASFYEDIFKYFYQYPLKMCCLYPTNDTNKDILTYGNHIINLAYHYDAIYGVDLTNHCTFIPISKDTLEALGKNFSLKYIPNGDVLFKLTTSLNASESMFNEIDVTKNILEMGCKQKIISEDEYKKIISKANDFICQKKTILQSFIVKNTELTHEIKKKMLFIK